MRITKELLVEKGACSDGIKWFEEHFPNLDADYQDVLTELGKQRNEGYAEWLLDNVGATDDVIEVDEIMCKNSFYFAGTVKVSKGIKVEFSIKAGRGIEAGGGIKAGGDIEAGLGIKAGGDIEAGWGIKAGRGIKAGWGIKAGLGIKAGGGIKAGRGYGVFAGLRIRVNDWKIDSIVSANKKPENLISGHWEEQ